MGLCGGSKGDLPLEASTTPMREGFLELGGDSPGAAAGGVGGGGGAAAGPSLDLSQVGCAEAQNEKYRQTMEDATVVDLDMPDGAGMVSVCDGHGGSKASAVAKEVLPQAAREFWPAEGPLTKEFFANVFEAVDKELERQEVMYEGSTVVVGIVRREGAQNILYVANAGDSRLVVSRGGEGRSLTELHHPSSESEAARVAAAGGFVARGKVNGMLRVTRSLGDLSLKSVVTSEPHVSRTMLTGSDKFMIIACDGLWDVVEEQESIDIVDGFSSAQDASEALVHLALERESTDNISVAVVFLQ